MFYNLQEIYFHLSFSLLTSIILRSLGLLSVSTPKVINGVHVVLHIILSKHSEHGHFNSILSSEKYWAF